MDYFYTPPDHIKGNSLFLDGKEYHHLAMVLRKRVGEKIFVLDGRGTTSEVKLKSMTSKQAQGEIVATHYLLLESTIEISLAIAVLKNPSRMDFLVEKCTELGVKRILSMRTEHTIAQHAKVERLQKIARAAMKQSGRSVLPVISACKTFEEVLEELKNAEGKFLLYEKQEKSKFLGTKLHQRKNVKSIALVVGPEGKFTEEEVEKTKKRGFVCVSLGKRRLRAETAAIVSVAYTFGSL